MLILFRIRTNINKQKPQTAIFAVLSHLIILVDRLTPEYPLLLTTGTGYPINSDFSYINQGQACPRRSGDKPNGIKRGDIIRSSWSVANSVTLQLVLCGTRANLALLVIRYKKSHKTLRFRLYDFKHKNFHTVLL